MPSCCELTGTIPRTRATGESPPAASSPGDAMVIRQRFSFRGIRDVLGGLLEQELHAKRVDALCNATLGVMHSASLVVCYHWPKPRRRPQLEAQARGEASGCHWQYQANIVCISGKSHIPTETSTGSNSPVTLMTHASYEAQLWNDCEVRGRAKR